MNDALLQWLAVRERTDARFRSKELAQAFASVIRAEDHIVDLGCGTMANMRYLDPFLGLNQKWIGIDKDSCMLGRAKEWIQEDRVRFQMLDLATELVRLPAGQGYAFTGSAFLDLTSKEWLDRFAAHSKKTPLLIAMSTAGQPMWTPVDTLDEPIRQRIELHQRSDHGFGPSLGADAACYLAEQLQSQGCDVILRETNWELDSRNPQDHEMISMMIEGVKRRVQSVQDPVDAQVWADRRRLELLKAELRLTVRHLDLLSIP